MVPEAEAKKKGFDLPKRFKLLPKGKEEQLLIQAKASTAVGEKPKP